MSNITVEDRDAIRVITINRPHVRNAVDRQTGDELFEAFSAFDKDDALSIAILTGAAGGGFCAGYDLKSITGTDTLEDIKNDPANEIGPMGPTRMMLSKPVIAAVEGHAVAGGMELALWCDLRVMAEDAIFGIYCRRFGVPLIDGGTFRLARLIGQSRAMDLILTGRPVDAEESKLIGLANRVVPGGTALDAAIELALQLSRFPQTCMRNDRMAMLQQWGMSHDEALMNEMRLGLDTMNSGETFEGASRFSSGEGKHGAFSAKGLANGDDNDR